MHPATPQCPHCESIELRRQGRCGFWQREVMSRLSYFPWECGQCRQIYMLKIRSTGYRPTPSGTAPTSLLDRFLLKVRN